MRALLIIAFTSFVATKALAQADDQIMADYRAFNEAVASGDDEEALLLSGEAYRKADAAWGPGRRQTGLLATNYANALAGAGKFSKAAEVFGRCAELLRQHADAQVERLFCIVGAADANAAEGKAAEAAELFDETISIGEPLAVQNKTVAGYVGVAYLGLATIGQIRTPRDVPRATIGSGSTSSRLARLHAAADRPCETIEEMAAQAIDYLNTAYGGRDPSLARALRIAGNCAEARKDYATALVRYERALRIVMEIEEVDGAAVRVAEGLYTHAKALKLVTESEASRGETDLDAQKPGCQLRRRNGRLLEICVEFRGGLYFPNSELFKGQEGFVLLEYDIDAKGRVQNLKVPVSWPGGVFDERAVKAAAGWRYAPPMDRETGAVTPVDGLFTIVRFGIKG